MSESEQPQPPSPPHPEAHHLSALRLFAIIALFLVAAGYAIWKSDRFQNLIHGVSQTRLAEALGRPVTFQTVEIRLFPPSIRLADVRIGNDPSLEGPLFAAEEVSIGGGISLVGNELRIGRVRALRPRLALTQLPDGKWNIPPGLSRPGKPGGVKLHIASVLIQEGMLDLQGRQIGISGSLEQFAAQLDSLPQDRYRGSLDARRATLKLPSAEPLTTQLSMRFLLDSARGVTLEDVGLSGAFGRLKASGSIETAGKTNSVLTASGDISIDEVERIFHSALGFSGGAHVDARVDIPPAGGFRITGNMAAPQVRTEQFTFDNVAASVAARPEGLAARIERADYAGGRATGLLRIANLTSKPQPMTLAVEAGGLSMERFFGDIGLKGTGLSGTGTLSIAMRWGEAGITRADGGGMLTIAAAPAASSVPGRFGLPVSGGGPLALVNGRIGFEGVEFRFPQSSLELTGGLKIGVWQPDFDFHLRSRDLTEVDRLFQNFLAAAGEKPERLGVAGSGEMRGHLSGTWGNPDATAEINAQDTVYADVPFGTVQGNVDMKDGAFVFHSLRVVEGEANLTLDGTARFKPAAGKPRLDLAIASHGYPLPRLLKYLDLDYPVDGKISGNLHVTGTPPDAVTGGGPVDLADAVLWGQKIPMLSGTVHFEPGRFALEGIHAELAGGRIRGDGSLAIKQKTFDARLSVENVPLDSLTALADISKDVKGKLSVDLTGGGSLDHPDLKVKASLAQAVFYGHPLPGDLAPRLEATMTHGVLDASASAPQHWTLTAKGDLFGHPAKMDVSLDAADLGSFFALTPFDLPAGSSATAALNGSIIIPEKAGEIPSGTFTVTRARVEFPNHIGMVEAKGDIHASLAAGKLTIQEFEATGVGTDIRIAGTLSMAQKPVTFTASASGPLDAGLLTLISPDLNPSGRITANVRASGTFDAPNFSGSVRIENGKYRMTSLTQVLDNIDGQITLQGSHGEVEIRARTGGGDVYASGGFNLKGMSLGDFRVSIGARRVALRYPQDLRLVVDADLVATGFSGNNILRGEVVLQRGTYSKDMELTISDLIASSRPAGIPIAQEAWKDRTALEVRIVSAASLEIRNNLARLTATVDLFARGTVANPTLVGQIVLDEGGRITFRDVRYDVESGVIAFANTAGFAPIVDLHLRTQIGVYDVGVGLVGTWPRIQTSFSADPPLPDEEIVGMLLTGGAPGASTTGNQNLASTAGNIAGSAATSFVTRPTQRLFKLDRFQIDPVFSASGPVDVRSTVGKQITPNLLVTYSQSFDTSKEPIVRLEWWLSDTVVLQGRRDENGIYLIDVRRRQRL
ncbi:MAG TPA: translocation/assembly module TamB domain-containing protein [Thermoanaerobaculia bacterium]|nr:translocation/assembly module TamB domain-containing protein [Thermoanaerobaculia bacterium]